ncbi:ABC-type phosphate transport system, periplasmic component (fragment) [Moritella yayanosii]|uniref:ABC-type phosphate transport system, periplasmic component n=1 Tax=Moritella yayanosii TaxID=69539 RepID=A0A330M0H7_9GAMM
MSLIHEVPKQSRLHKDLTGRTPAQVNAYWSRNVFTGLGQNPEVVSPIFFLTTIHK